MVVIHLLELDVRLLHHLPHLSETQNSVLVFIQIVEVAFESVIRDYCIFGEVTAHPRVLLIVPFFVSQRLISRNLRVVAFTAFLELVPEHSHVVLMPLVPFEVALFHGELLHDLVRICVLLHIFTDGVDLRRAVSVVPSHGFFLESYVDVVSGTFRMKHWQVSFQVFASHDFALCLSHQGVVGRADCKGRLHIDPGRHVVVQIVIVRQVLISTIDIKQGLHLNSKCVGDISEREHPVFVEVISFEQGRELSVGQIYRRKVVIEGFELVKINLAILV